MTAALRSVRLTDDPNDLMTDDPLPPPYMTLAAEVFLAAAPHQAPL